MARTTRGKKAASPTVVKKRRRRKKNLPAPRFVAPYASGAKKRELRPQVCNARQAKIDQRLSRTHRRGLEVLSRKALNRVAKRHGVKVFQRTNAAIIEELRVAAKDLPDVA